MRIVLIVFFYISTCSAKLNAAEQVDFSFPNEEINLTQSDYLELSLDNTLIQEPKFKKLKAILLAVFLGHFGVHRIYLGTSPNVPVVYSLTLGGGFGLLPLLDILAIMTTQELEKFCNNKQVFMWSKSKK